MRRSPGRRPGRHQRRRRPLRPRGRRPDDRDARARVRAEGLIEQAGDKLGIVERRVKADLEKFKSLIEDEGYASGAWRGTVPGAAGTPGVEAAEASKGDSGSAGLSAKTVIAGAAGVAAAAAGGIAAAKKRSGDETSDTETVVAEPGGTTVPPPAIDTAGGDAVDEPRFSTERDAQGSATSPAGTDPARGV